MMQHKSHSLRRWGDADVEHMAKCIRCQPCHVLREGVKESCDKLFHVVLREAPLN